MVLPRDEVLERALDVLFPRHCIGCCGETGKGPYRFLCRKCRTRLDYIDRPYCLSCGYPFYGRMEQQPLCPKCLDWPPSFEAGRSLFLHRGVGAEMIKELKYHEGLYVLSDISRLIYRWPDLEIWFGAAQLVPVPLHPLRLRERGFNQSEVICDMLVRQFPALEKNNCLRRVVYTNTQTRMGRNDRRDNVKNAFALQPKAVLDPSRLYIIVDDVFTTGSTLNACSDILRAGGARRIRVFTLAHG